MILLSSLTMCVQQILQKRPTKGKLKHCLKINNNTYEEPEQRTKNVSRCFPIDATIIYSLCKGKVQKLFESLQCLRIQAARSDVSRLYSLDM